MHVWTPSHSGWWWHLRPQPSALRTCTFLLFFPNVFPKVLAVRGQKGQYIFDCHTSKTVRFCVSLKNRFGGHHLRPHGVQSVQWLAVQKAAVGCKGCKQVPARLLELKRCANTNNLRAKWWYDWCVLLQFCNPCTWRLSACPVYQQAGFSISLFNFFFSHFGQSYISVGD